MVILPDLIADAESVEAYVPIEGLCAAVILHTRGDPGPLVRLVPGAAEPVNETVSLTLMRASRETKLDFYRAMITVIGSIGVVATILAAAGMFALVAFTVAQRTRELGKRIALGAGPARILNALLRQNMRPTALGAAAGAILAAALARPVRSMIPMARHDTVGGGVRRGSGSVCPGGGSGYAITGLARAADRPLHYLARGIGRPAVARGPREYTGSNSEERSQCDLRCRCSRCPRDLWRRWRGGNRHLARLRLNQARRLKLLR